MIDFEDIFQGKGFEIKSVGDIVVGGNRFRIGIDHNGFKTGFPKGKGCVYTTIIKFNALPDPIGTAPQDHDLFSIRGFHFILIPIRGIIIRGVSLKLRGTGIDQAKGGADAHGLTPLTDRRRFTTPEVSKLTVGKSGLLGLPHRFVF